MPPKKKVVKKTVRKTPSKRLRSSGSTDISEKCAPKVSTEIAENVITVLNTTDETPIPETKIEAIITETTAASIDHEENIGESSLPECDISTADSETLPQQTLDAETVRESISTDSKVLRPEASIDATLSKDVSAKSSIEEVPSKAPAKTKRIVKIKKIKKVIRKVRKPVGCAVKEAEIPNCTSDDQDKVYADISMMDHVKIKKIKKVIRKVRKPVGCAVKEAELPNCTSDDQDKVYANISMMDPGDLRGENKKEVDEESGNLVEEEELVVNAPTVSQRKNRKETEVFIGGLDRGAKEDDIRKAFEKIGEIAEIRLITDGQTGKNKGYAFLRYASSKDAKRAVSELSRVQVCGKLCGVSPLDGNDTIFLGNIDKRWKKEDIIKLLKGNGIENIDTVRVVPDPNDTESNRGFAFVEFETNRDAQNAFKKLQKRDVFDKDLNIKVSWAEPLNEPSEEDMLKVKSVFVEGIPLKWDEEKIKIYFAKFGNIERIVLSKNIPSSKRKDFAFINYVSRESAVACVEAFSIEDLIDNGVKVNVRVSIAKPSMKQKQTKPKMKQTQNKGGSQTVSNDSSRDKPKIMQRNAKATVDMFTKIVPGSGAIDQRSATTHDLLKVLREQAAWNQPQPELIRGQAFPNYYTQPLHGGKRLLSSLGSDPYVDPRMPSRPRLEVSPTSSSFGYMHISRPSLPYYNQPSAVYPTATGTYYRV